MLKKIAIRTATIFISLLLCLLLLELTLRTGWFDDNNNPHPIWIPYKFDKIHNEIEEKNWQFAKLNPYKFTDRERSYKKKEGDKRIAVLGDSFVWGTGIPNELTWNHQLEKMLNEKYKNVEVLSWGFPAWSTMDELSFLENHGLKYDIDMLIVDYVNNDPHIQRIELKVFSWHKSAGAKILKIFFPNAISFIRAYLYNFLFKHFDDYGYSNWIEKLHSEENLNEYGKLLQDFAQFCHNKNIKLLFVLTPSNHDEVYRRHFDKIIPLLERAHIKYIDLYPESKREYGHINIRKLWANPGDPHPGQLLTNQFARNVLDYLERESILPYIQKPEVQNILSLPHRAIDRSGADKNVVNIALMHDDLDIRRKAVHTLVRLNNPFNLEQITDALIDSNPEVREAAAYALGELNIESAINPLLETLKDKNALVRKSAVLALEKKEDPRIIEPLIMVATQDSDPFVRRRSLLVLAKYKNANITEALFQSLKDDFFYNKKTSIIALGKLKDPRAVEPIIEMLFDDVDEVRLSAAEALGEIRDPRAVDKLKSVSLEDDNPLVRDFAATAINKITGKEYGKYRRKLLRLWQMF
jgi:hypothetical protein